MWERENLKDRRQKQSANHFFFLLLETNNFLFSSPTTWQPKSFRDKNSSLCHETSRQSFFTHVRLYCKYFDIKLKTCFEKNIKTEHLFLKLGTKVFDFNLLELFVWFILKCFFFQDQGWIISAQNAIGKKLWIIFADEQT